MDILQKVGVNAFITEAMLEHYCQFMATQEKTDADIIKKRILLKADELRKEYLKDEGHNTGS